MTALLPGMRLPRRMCRCGAVKLVAVRPGSDAVRLQEGGVDVLLQGEVPDTAECFRCNWWWQSQNRVPNTGAPENERG